VRIGDRSTSASVGAGYRLLATIHSGVARQAARLELVRAVATCGILADWPDGIATLPTKRRSRTDFRSPNVTDVGAPASKRERLPAIDVVVVSYNSRDQLRDCVDSLARIPEACIVVVDNASPDAGLATIADLDVVTIEHGCNAGFASACNTGWRVGTAPYVLCINPDSTIDADSLRRLVWVLEAERDVAVAAPRILDANGALEYSQRRFPRLCSTYANALFLNQIFRRGRWASELVREPRAYERPGSPEWVSGACMLVRRSALETAGGWDESFFMYCEDKDLCRRIRDAGRDIRFEPGAVVVHAGGCSAPRGSLLPVLAASRIRYARKHRGRVAAVLEQLGILLASLTHAVVSRGEVGSRAGHAAALLVAAGLRAPRLPAGAAPYRAG
jgi:N-acetylglucosaminyl-diphospho-decaprenol L-rhamnosyltransferase